MGTEEWMTPPEIIRALGPFDLDPCAAINPFYTCATVNYTIVDNGLSKNWIGRVWLNPPYGLKAEHWLARLAHHGNGIALIFARTETEAFFNRVWDRADALLFLRGRVNFYRNNGRRSKNDAGAPSVLVAYGSHNTAALRSSAIPGHLVELKHVGR